MRFNDSNIGVLRGRFLSIEGGIKTDMVKYGAFIGQYAQLLHQVDDQRKLNI